jgi:6-phosphogluconolactonase (cycloisomerase 2 family)
VTVPVASNGGKPITGPALEEFDIDANASPATEPLSRAVNDSSIAAFAVDPATGHLTAAGHIPTEPVPSAFGLDPAGHFLFAAGTASGRRASYRVNHQSGALTQLAVEEVGQRPAAVLATRLG